MFCDLEKCLKTETNVLSFFMHVWVCVVGVSACAVGVGVCGCVPKGAASLVPNFLLKQVKRVKD